MPFSGRTGGNSMQLIHVSADPQGRDRSEELNALIRQAEEGATIHLDAGEYYVTQPIIIRQKKRLTIEGPGAVILTDVKGYLDEEDPGCDAFHLEESTGITICGVTVRTFLPNNVGGTVVGVTKEWLDIRIDTPSAPGWSGKEYVTQLYLISPDRALLSENIGSCYRKHWCTFGGEVPNSHTSITNIPHEVLPDGTWRFFGVQQTKFGAGTRCWLDHQDKSTAFLCKDCSDITFEDVNIPDWSGMVFIILPRCMDFTFRRVFVRPDDPERHPCAASADVIHTTGLGGQLVVEDCWMEGIGDDVTNIHTPALRVRAIEGRYAVLFFDKEYPLFPKRWAFKGDVLDVYSGKDLRRKGQVTLEWTLEDQIRPDRPDLLEKGDFVINTCYRPDIVIRRSTFLHARSRLCVQTARSLEISDCKFKMDSMKAQIYVSSAFNYWGEAGGVENVFIHHNQIHAARCPGIWVRLNEKEADRMALVHRNIRIEQNAFYECHPMGMPDPAAGAVLDIASVSGLTVRDNTFDIQPEEAIFIRHCDGVTVENNTKR